MKTLTLAVLSIAFAMVAGQLGDNAFASAQKKEKEFAPPKQQTVGMPTTSINGKVKITKSGVIVTDVQGQKDTGVLVMG